MCFSAIEAGPLETDNLVCDQEDRRLLVSKLDYVYRHYRYAVSEQPVKVISIDKYKIVERVLKNAMEQAKKCLSNPVTPELAYVEQIVADYKNIAKPSKLESNIEHIRNDLIKKFDLSTSPKNIPDLKKGKKVYDTICAQCHGDRGDANTAVSQTFKVKPTAFSDPNIVDRLSPFQMANTIKDGVEATNMPSFAGLSEKERWAVANYILFLASKENSGGTAKKSVYVPWYKTMDLTNGELKTRIQRLGVIPSALNASVSYIRSLEMYQDKKLQAPLNRLYQTELLFVKTRMLIEKDNQREARQIALKAYFDYFKKIEPWLVKEGYAQEVTDFETQMFNFTSSFSRPELNQADLLNIIIEHIQGLSKDLIKKT
ncbi:MAG TPA: cytochrome c [Oligoflexia bacterium]|nr:cytochrome c [Oligoflexia bacterium]